MHSSVMFCNDVDFRQIMLHGFCDAINQHKHNVTTRYGLKIFVAYYAFMLSDGRFSRYTKKEAGIIISSWTQASYW